MGKLLIKNCLLVTMEKDCYDEQESSFLGEIGIEGNEIIHIGKPSTIDKNFNPSRIIDAKGMIAMPGFINAHTHAAMSLFRGYADDLPLMEWLENRIWPLEAKLTKEDVYWGTKLSVLEMLKAGVTTFADMYFFMDEVAKVVVESGIRASLARGLTGGDGSGAALKEAADLFHKWHGYDDDRITVMFGPHAPYTCLPEFLGEIMDEAKKLKAGIHIHLAETRDEIINIKKQYGKPPVELMEYLGLFELPVLAAHCVHLEPKEIDILGKYNVKVAHNPESNMKLASGVAPVPDFLEKNVIVALGTDGPASNNNLELFGEMRMAALLHKVERFDPTAISAYQALTMATKNGGQALGLTKVGILKKGYKADLILVDYNQPHFYPQHNAIAHLVYSAQPGDIKTVIVNGEILIEQGRALKMDEEEIYRKAEETFLRIIS